MFLLEYYLHIIFPNVHDDFIFKKNVTSKRKIVKVPILVFVNPPVHHFWSFPEEFKWHDLALQMHRSLLGACPGRKCFISASLCWTVIITKTI